MSTDSQSLAVATKTFWHDKIKPRWKTRYEDQKGFCYVQCAERKIEAGPIATFPAWKDKGRFIRKGEKALVLCMPITGKKKDSEDPEATYTHFAFKPRWFALSQTEGDPVEPQGSPEWSKALALERV